MTTASDVERRADAVRTNRGLRILCPNGHLGFAPTKLGSFERGLAAEPDMIACDSGSCDCGPIPLGADSSARPLAWQRHDIEAMLIGARRLRVPMMIGSAGDTGTNSRVKPLCRDRQGARRGAQARALQGRLLLFGGRQRCRAAQDHVR